MPLFGAHFLESAACGISDKIKRKIFGEVVEDKKSV